MITAVCFLLLAATVPLLRGRLSLLGRIRIQAWWTIVLALVIQVFLLEIFAGTFGGLLAATIHLLSYGLALVFVWHNRHITGMGLTVFGGLLNLIAIAANGGVMPAQRQALETAGIIVDSPEFENSAVIDDARLWFLGDIFAIPEGIPFANVFSIGDIILVFGAGITVHTISRSHLGRLIVRLNPLATADATADLGLAVDQGPSVDHGLAVDQGPSVDQWPTAGGGATAGATSTGTIGAEEAPAPSDEPNEQRQPL
ncbi:MAG: DUF5317 domain-containing protein [Actinomycetota bacterium]